MSPEDQAELDYLAGWRSHYDGAKESRNACIMGWLCSSAALAIYVGGRWPECIFLGATFFLGGIALALLSHYQASMETYYTALKGTRDEPPLDELAARRRR